MDLGKRARIVIVVLVAAVVAISVFAYLSQRPSDDEDGDGVPNASDSAPYDPSIWDWGNATVSLTVENHFNRTVRFVVFSSVDRVHSTAQWMHDISANGNYTQSLFARWPMGPVTTNLTILVTGMPWQEEGHYFEEMVSTRNVTVANAGETSITIAYPGQFIA